MKEEYACQRAESWPTAAQDAGGASVRPTADASGSGRNLRSKRNRPRICAEMVGRW